MQQSLKTDDATPAALPSSTAIHDREQASEFLQKNQELAYLVAKLLAQRLNSITGYLVDLKAQYEEQEDHLGMVDEVLEALVHDQDEPFDPGSDRDPDTTL